MHLPEPLEPRRHLSATLVDGALRILGTRNADTISVSLHAHQFRVTINSTTKIFAASKVHELKLRALAGNDSITLAGPINIRNSIEGDRGADTIVGSDGEDQISGGGGDDLIMGGDGQDMLFGEIGNDTIQGGKADDFISGDAGDDSLLGEEGQDILSGGRGDDFLNGNVHSDFLTGDDGADTLFDHDGNDTLMGMKGNDTLNTLDQHRGDELHGGQGKDHIKRDHGDPLNPRPSQQESDPFPFDFPSFSEDPVFTDVPSIDPTTQPTTEPTTQPSDPDPTPDPDPIECDDFGCW